MKLAQFYTHTHPNVRCTLCPRNCIIQENQLGNCKVRKNIGGKLFSMSYGHPTALQIDPVEKKPLFHFLPGSRALSLGTLGCNLHCLNCQNWQSSQSKYDSESREISPKEVVQAALANECPVIAYTYNEPTVFYEYMTDCAKLAAKHKLSNIMVSNGYINQEPLSKLCKYISATNIDLKAFSNTFYKNICAGSLEPVLETLKTLHKKDVWTEVTTLVIPDYNESEIEQISAWISENLGRDAPLHLARFHPDYKLILPSTPESTMHQAYKIAKNHLNYVYLGNMATKNSENTYCPKCSTLLVERSQVYLPNNLLAKGRCPQCNQKIPGVWQ
ncbi:MAG: AmmeMemoRadiSam system radical SAM enzyme [Candidatus Woesearchaeota archaeon]